MTTELPAGRASDTVSGNNNGTPHIFRWHSDTVNDTSHRMEHHPTRSEVWRPSILGVSSGISWHVPSHGLTQLQTKDLAKTPSRFWGLPSERSGDPPGMMSPNLSNKTWSLENPICMSQVGILSNFPNLGKVSDVTNTSNTLIPIPCLRSCRAGGALGHRRGHAGRHRRPFRRGRVTAWWAGATPLQLAQRVHQPGWVFSAQ